MTDDPDTFIKKVVAEAPPLTAEQIDRLRVLLLMHNTPTLTKTLGHLAATELTPRELEVLDLIATGKKYHEIGCLLHISSRTVQAHSHNMMKKLGIKNRSQLVRYALTRATHSYGMLAAVAAVTGRLLPHVS